MWGCQEKACCFLSGMEEYPTPSAGKEYIVRVSPYISWTWKHKDCKLGTQKKHPCSILWNKGVFNPTIASYDFGPSESMPLYTNCHVFESPLTLNLAFCNVSVKDFNENRGIQHCDTGKADCYPNHKGHRKEPWDNNKEQNGKQVEDCHDYSILKIVNGQQKCVS